MPRAPPGGSISGRACWKFEHLAAAHFCHECDRTHDAQTQVRWAVAVRYSDLRQYCHDISSPEISADGRAHSSDDCWRIRGKPRRSDHVFDRVNRSRQRSTRREKDGLWPCRDFASSDFAALKLPLANYGTRPKSGRASGCRCDGFRAAEDARSA